MKMAKQGSYVLPLPQSTVASYQQRIQGKRDSETLLESKAKVREETTHSAANSAKGGIQKNSSQSSLSKVVSINKSNVAVCINSAKPAKRRPNSQYRPRVKGNLNSLNSAILTSDHGMGLWCHAKKEQNSWVQEANQANKQLPPLQAKIKNERLSSSNSQKRTTSSTVQTIFTKEVEEKVEASLAQMLEKQVTSLSAQVDKAELDKSQMIIRFNKMKQSYEYILSESQQVESENQQLKEKASFLEERNREIQILKHENAMIKAKEEQYRKEYESEVKERAKQSIETKYKIKELQELIQEYFEDNESLRCQIQSIESTLFPQEDQCTNEMSFIENVSIIPSDTSKLNDRITDFDIKSTISKSECGPVSSQQQILELKRKIKKEKESK